MLSYLRCIKSHRGSNDPECRNLSKSYLSCRMDRYVHTSLFVICLQPHPTHFPIGPGYDVVSSSKGAEDLVIPSCQNLSNQVTGKVKSGATKHARERRGSLDPSHLVRCETSELSNRHSSSQHSPLSAQHCLEQQTCLRSNPNPHFLLSHCFGSIRTERNASPIASREACADYSQ
jgi:hypothetical protein